MNPVLELELPWLAPQPLALRDVTVIAGSSNRLEFEDGIELEVVVLVPSRSSAVDDVIADVAEETGPGRVVLVAGAVPVDWRPELRRSGVSWLSTDGQMELSWPRLATTAHRVSVDAGLPNRRREPLPLQKHRALVVQELCMLAFEGRLPIAVGELARSARVDPASASTACEALARHGYASKSRQGRQVLVDVEDVGATARLLADRTGWRHANVLWAHGYGRSLLDVADRVSAAAAQSGASVAITGRIGSAFLGVLGTGEPQAVRIRAAIPESELADIPSALGVEVVNREEANVAIAIDRWGLGTTHARVREFQQYTARIAPMIRVWCDIADEPRGAEFAAQIWEELRHG